MDAFGRVLGRAKLNAKDYRFNALLAEAMSKFPKEVRPLVSVTRMQLRRRGGMEGLVGLTSYCCVEVGDRSRNPKDRVAQTITFYTELLDKISDKAAIGVIAHELAHAWLNEYVYPEASKKREEQADELARSWGYGEYLDALAAETESP